MPQTGYVVRDFDGEIISTIQQMKIAGASPVDVLRLLARRGLRRVERLDYFRVAFDVGLPGAQMASLWDPTNSNETRDRETNDILEGEIRYGSFAANHLVPEDLIRELREHELWLESDGKSGKQLRKRDGAVLRSLNLSNRTLSKCDLVGADFDEVVLMNCIICDANFATCSLSLVDLGQSKITRSDFSRCRISDCGFAEDDASFTAFYGSKLDKVDFRLAKAASSDFSDCELNEVNFDGCDLTHAKFDRVVFSNCSFKNANVEFSSFDDALFDSLTRL